MKASIVTALAVCAMLAVGAQSKAQQAGTPTAPPMPPTTPYGPPITLEQAKKVADGAEAEAKKRNQNMAIAIVEPSGELVYFRRMDGTQYASIMISQSKAVSAAKFRRATKSFRERIVKGDMSPMALVGAVASDGGIPIGWNGKIIGAIGTSGGADHAVSQAGVDALK